MQRQRQIQIQMQRQPVKVLQDIVTTTAEKRKKDK